MRHELDARDASILSAIAYATYVKYKGDILHRLQGMLKGDFEKEVGLALANNGENLSSDATNLARVMHDWIDKKYKGKK